MRRAPNTQKVPTALISERGRGEGAQVRVELAVVRRRQRAGHRQDERHGIDDPTGTVEGVAVDGPRSGRGGGLEGDRLVEHRQPGGPAAQLVAVGDDHRGVCDQHRVDVDGDDVGSAPQHECPVALIDELLLELP
jgi:hypothetical protein